MTFSNTNNSHFPLHAAAVLHRGKAYIFAASTGAGKTTLSAYLSNSGFAYISDDEIHIDMTSLCVHAAPKPLHLREDSVAILKHYGINITAPVTEKDSFRRVVYLPDHFVQGDFPIGRLYFKQRSTVDTVCKPIPPREAVQLIIGNLITPEVDMSSCLRCAIQLAPKCRQLIYSDLRYVREVIESE